jgi:hypothetical protein
MNRNPKKLHRPVSYAQGGVMNTAPLGGDSRGRVHVTDWAPSSRVIVQSTAEKRTRVKIAAEDGAVLLLVDTGATQVTIRIPTGDECTALIRGLVAAEDAAGGAL